MHDHELELIAAFAEGRLDDETQARALIDSSPEYREEYEAQKLAYDALSSTGTVSLSEIERASLHRDVWTALRTEAAAQPAKTPWYYRWVPVAAGMFVVVGIVAVVNQDGDEAIELAADFPVTTTIAEGAAGGLDAEEQDDSDEGSAPTLAGESADGGETTGTTASMSDDLGAEDVSIYETEAENVRQRAFGLRLQEYGETASDADSDTTCVEEAGLVDQRIVATLTAPDDGHRMAVAYPEDETLETAPIAFIDLETCELDYLDQ